MGSNQLKEKMRLAIFFFYDKEGIVDEYISYMLNDLKKSISELMIICNGDVEEKSLVKLKLLTDNVILRENKGFDVWAYKTAIEKYGWPKLEQFDEVILMNYTMFGPLYPFSEMFQEMDKRDIDFWGITKHHSVEFDCFGTCKYGYIPEHIQSNFLVIRKKLIKSKDYQKMWENMPQINSYSESVGFYEAIFTKEFTEKGFKSDVYINTDDLEGYTRYPLMMMAPELVKNRRCPIIKIKGFSQNYYDIITDTLGNCTLDTFEYIQKNLSYDVNLIWDHLLRVYNMGDIKRLMHLNYILPKEYTIKHKSNDKRIALMMHLYYPDLIDYCLEYAKSMPEYADLIITTPIAETRKQLKEKVKELELNRIHIIDIENRGRDVSALLVGCAPYIKDYDYVCFVHDKKTTQIKPYCNGESFSYKCFENTLGSRDFVENIITTFENNPRLGLLTPPPPNHGTFYQIVGSEWASNYENTISLAYKLGLKCNIYWENEPIAPLGTMFWFRPEALKTLFDVNWKYEDFPKEPNAHDGTLLHAIERIYPFVVQHEGYYPAWVLSDKFARIEITNLHFMLREINKDLLGKYFTTNLLDMTEKMKTNFRFHWSRNVGKKALVKKYCPVVLWDFMKKIYLRFKR